MLKVLHFSTRWMLLDKFTFHFLQIIIKIFIKNLLQTRGERAYLISVPAWPEPETVQLKNARPPDARKNF